MIKMRSLKKLSQESLTQWLYNQIWVVEHPPNANQVTQYLLPAAHFMADVAMSCCYQKSPYLTTVFLPILVGRNRIHITKRNMNSFYHYCVNSDNKDEAYQVSNVKYLKVEDLCVYTDLYSNLLLCLRNLRNLTLVVINSDLSDDILTVMCMNCPHLEIFDAREERKKLLTDLGISYLCFCKKLRKIYLPMCNQPKYTSRGVALLLRLPEIEQVLCPTLIMEKAILFLYNVQKVKEPLHLRSLLVEGLSDENIFYVPNKMLRMCPQLEVLAVHVKQAHVDSIGDSIHLLENLKKLLLIMKNEIPFPYSIDLGRYGDKLIFLHLETKDLPSAEIQLIHDACHQLKTLIIILSEISESWHFVDEECLIKPLLPTVENFELKLSREWDLFEIMNIYMPSLRNVHFGFSIVDDIDESLRRVLQEGGWRHVERLILPIERMVSPDVVKDLVSTLTKLSYLSLTVQDSEEAHLPQFIQQTSPDLEWHLYPDAMPKTTEILSHIAPEFWTTHAQ